jgi:hypothetical protein
VGTLRGVPNDRYRNLTPGAVIAALRSFPRRYRSALTSEPTSAREDPGALRTPDGRSVRQVLADTTEAMSQLAESLKQALFPVAGRSLAAVAAGEPLSGADAARHDLRGWLEVLESTALTIADRLDAAPSADLLRTGTTAAGVTVSALDIGRHAVRVSAEALREIEHAVGNGQPDDGNDD